jgi:hypothetical protein
MYLMKKKMFLTIFVCALIVQTKAQAPRVDTVAVSILDKMSAIIGSLNSCSVTVKANYDITSRRLGLVKHSDEQQLFMHGSDKLLVRSNGDRGTKYISYNGKTLTYYSLDRNQYAQIEAPPTVMEMIDTINRIYGIEFPAADLFYPSFVDDILSEATNLQYLGLTKVDGKECYHIAGTAKDKTFQFWIADDAYSLPLKVVIVYTSKEMNPQFEATLTDWKVNPDLPDALFDFSAPPKAKKIKLVSLTASK